MKERYEQTVLPDEAANYQGVREPFKRYREIVNSKLFVYIELALVYFLLGGSLLFSEYAKSPDSVVDVSNHKLWAVLVLLNFLKLDERVWFTPYFLCECHLMLLGYQIVHQNIIFLVISHRHYYGLSAISAHLDWKDLVGGLNSFVNSQVFKHVFEVIKPRIPIILMVHLFLFWLFNLFHCMLIIARILRFIVIIFEVSSWKVDCFCDQFGEVINVWTIDLIFLILCKLILLHKHGFLLELPNHLLCVD